MEVCMMKPRKKESCYQKKKEERETGHSGKEAIINSPLFLAISDKRPTIHGLPVPGPWRKPGTCLLITRPNINLTS